MPRLRRLAAAVIAAAAVWVSPVHAAEGVGAPRIDGPIRPKHAAPPQPIAPAAPRGTKSWTKAPDGRLQWRDGATSVTVSGSVTVDTMVRSGGR